MSTFAAVFGRKEPQRHRDTEKTEKTKSNSVSWSRLSAGVRWLPLFFSVSLCLCGSFSSEHSKMKATTTPAETRETIMATGLKKEDDLESSVRAKPAFLRRVRHSRL